MIKSMTGYGRAQGNCNGARLTIEIRSLNHRFRNLTIKLPEAFNFLEPPLRKALQERFARGSIDLSVRFPQGQRGAGRLTLDADLAKAYYKILDRLRKELNLKEGITLSHVAQCGGLIKSEDFNGDLQHQARRILQLVPRAMGALEASRRAEGRALLKDLRSRLRGVERAMRRVRKRLPRVVRDYQKRLRDRVQELTGGVVPDPVRLAQEVALLAERSDISEEISRMDSHLRRFREMLNGRRPVGRTLDFLLQEMVREVNTIGSKCNDLAIAHEVVLIKGELEKIKEQVQNIE